MSRSIESQRIIQSAFFFAARIPGTRIISFTRTATEVTDAADFDAEMGSFEHEWCDVVRQEHDVLLDLRADKHIVDPELRRRYRERRDALVVGFRRAAILSALPEERTYLNGVLSSLGPRARLLFDESVAFRWLRG